MRMRTMFFRSSTVPDPLYLEINLKKQSIADQIIKQIREQINEEYDEEWTERHYELLLMKDGRIIGNKANLKEFDGGLEETFYIVFKKPQHLIGTPLKATDHKPYEMLYNELFSIRSMNYLHGTDANAKKLHESIMDFDNKLIKQIIEGNETLMEMCENNDDLKNIWNYKREKEFFSMFSEQAIERALNQLGVGKPLTEEQEQEIIDYEWDNKLSSDRAREKQERQRKERQQRGLPPEQESMDMFGFPYFHNFMGSFRNIQKTEREIEHERKLEEGIKMRKQQELSYARLHENESDYDVAWRTYLIYQNEADNPRLKFKIQLSILSQMGWDDQPQNIFALSKTHLKDRYFEDNVNSAITMIYRMRRKKADWEERMKLPEEERNLLERQMEKRHQQVFKWDPKDPRYRDEESQDKYYLNNQAAKWTDKIMTIKSNHFEAKEKKKWEKIRKEYEEELKEEEMKEKEKDPYKKKVDETILEEKKPQQKREYAKVPGSGDFDDIFEEEELKQEPEKKEYVKAPGSKPEQKK